MNQPEATPRGGQAPTSFCCGGPRWNKPQIPSPTTTHPSRDPCPRRPGDPCRNYLKITFLRPSAGVAEAAAPCALREVRREGGEKLGRDRGVLPIGGEGLLGIRGETRHSDPGHPPAGDVPLLKCFCSKRLQLPPRNFLPATRVPPGIVHQRAIIVEAAAVADGNLAHHRRTIDLNFVRQLQLHVGSDYSAAKL